MSYIIRFKNAHQVIGKAPKIKLMESVDLYLVKDGELKTQLLNGRTQYLSGVKMTHNKEEATRFDNVSDATKYQQLVGVKGRRGEINACKV